MSIQLKIFNWFFSILMLTSTSALAQQINAGKDDDRLKKSEAPIEEGKPVKQKTFFKRDLKFGWDVSNLLVGALSSPRFGLDFSIDYSLKQNFYGVVEFGKNNYSDISEAMEYFSEGTYVRLGFESNKRKNEEDLSRDIFYLGARYAFASFQQTLENYQSTSTYWPVATGDQISFNNQAHWAEALLGFKVEVMKNMYLGLGFRLKFMIFQSGDETIKPAIYVPGYGKAAGNITIGFNYSIYYNLPLNYSKKNPNRAN
jgi:hypothetical protein